MRRLGLALVIAILLAALPASPLSQASLVIELWDHVRTVPWGTLYRVAQLQHAPAACEQFVAPPDEVVDGTGATEVWSRRCREASATTTREWFFYAFNPRPPILEQLEQFRVSVGGLPVDQLETAARELSRLASTAYGPPSDRIREFGSSFWRQTARWQTSDVELVIGVDEFPNRPAHLNVFVRHRPLVDLLVVRERLENEALSREAEPGTPSAGDLAGQVRTEFPEAAVLLTTSTDRAAIDQAGLANAVAALLDKAKAANAERAGQLTWAAERLAGRLAMTERESGVGDRGRARLAAYGLTFEWDELGGGWAYGHDLLWRLWADYRRAPWGHQAFAALLARGWDTRVGCRSGSDRFRDVIFNGEAFLRANSRTPLRAQILLMLAQAYETWWALSLASDRDDYADRRKYQVGASSAKQQAIKAYDELAQRYAKSEEADYARLALPRLHLGIDTGQRRFFCVYD